jgi:hypothetical protein
MSKTWTGYCSVDRGLDVISFGEPAVADEGAGDAGEGQEVLGFALVASVQSAVSPYSSECTTAYEVMCTTAQATSVSRSIA